MYTVTTVLTLMMLSNEKVDNTVMLSEGGQQNDVMETPDNSDNKLCVCVSAR